MAIDRDQGNGDQKARTLLLELSNMANLGSRLPPFRTLWQTHLQTIPGRHRGTVRYGNSNTEEENRQWMS